MTQAKKYLVIWLPPVLVLAFLLVYALFPELVQWAAGTIRCPTYSLFGVLCPGCGGTRSFMALLRGEPLLALHENPLTLGLLLCGVLYYAERVCACLGKEIRLIPRGMKFWGWPIGLVLVWALLRNFIPVLMPFT